MFNKSRSIITAREKDTLKGMCRDILLHIKEKERVLKVSFFYHVSCAKEYIDPLDTLRATVKETIPCNTPLMSYIAQGTECDRLSAEITYLDDCGIGIERHDNYVLLSRGDSKEIITCGIVPHDVSVSAFEQSTEIFSVLNDILQSNGFDASHIYRQWNYIQHITSGKDGGQNYQEFNDARSIFYSNSNWSNGYPAATGIGTSAGGVMVELYAIKGSEATNKAIDNPLQIAAHNYSQKVLDGKVIDTLTEKTTPKFERARILGDTIYISGTAAIKGEQSNSSDDATVQTAETMEIMDRLVAKDNIPAENNGSRYSLLRVYVKNADSLEEVKAYMEAHYPSIDKLFLVADICRPELLVEIEGIAHI